MATRKPLTEKIAEFLDKTGFPLEVDCIRMLSSRNWMVAKGLAYRDPDEPSLRELDIAAWTTRVYAYKPLRMAVVRLMIECKKSERPWIFFTHPEGAVDLRSHIKHVSSMGELFATEAMGLGRPDAQLAKWQHPYSGEVGQAKTYVEYNPRRKGEPSAPDIRSGLMTAVKSVADEMSRLGGAMDEHTGGFAVFYFPVVVLRGHLFEARPDEHGKMAVWPSKHVRVVVDFLPRGEEFKDGGMTYIVDILHDESLAAYIDLVESGLRPLFKRIGELLDEAAKSATPAP